ncbi:cysteine-rich CWC family protein [Spirosoma aerolatum]|uniref:cysteine-rich CWC family protein n=1 Tax=Spirosoma aerolatum TaxID=1211326 RepID=UPI0009AE0106|nr:cysteine-rich CWC family protein [Spirosoma aerolatum]
MEQAGCNKHESKTCPRCQRRFECRVGSINLCQCQPVRLNPEQQQYIETRYADCLCADCLCADCLLALRTAYNQLDYNKAITRILYGH